MAIQMKRNRVIFLLRHPIFPMGSVTLNNSLITVRRTSISAVESLQGDYEPDKPACPFGNPHVDPLPNYGGESFGRTPGDKLYELKNHLGNVLAVVSDLKLGQDDFAVDTAQYYYAQLMSVQDYPTGTTLWLSFRLVTTEQEVE
ncbi:MAG: hypothetical protein H6581_21475 [Bacteroidia bacterium]|nr:hypothetical protein [Bacteroidia bacterium]